MSIIVVLRAARLSTLFAFLLSLLVITPGMYAQSATPCVLGYSVGFFNGVGNTESDGIDGRNGQRVFSGALL